MTDGTTATTVLAPISPAEGEVDMSVIKQVFDRGLNAIVDASHLRQELNDLRLLVADLKADIERVRDQNKWLDESLQRVRQERDAAQKAEAEANTEVTRLRAVNEDLVYRNGLQSNMIADLNHQNTLLLKERDDYGLQVMDLEERLKATQDKLDKVLSIAGSILGVGSQAPRLVGHTPSDENVPYIPGQAVASGY